LKQEEPSNGTLADTAIEAIFVLSVLLAVLALPVRYAHVAITIVSAHSFETLLISPDICFADSDVAGLGACKVLNRRWLVACGIFGRSIRRTMPR
jgi:uncharacterized membrane protein YccF (DUF307 family)